jgi:hypothetical protein
MTPREYIWRRCLARMLLRSARPERRTAHPAHLFAIFLNAMSFVLKLVKGATRVYKPPSYGHGREATATFACVLLPSGTRSGLRGRHIVHYRLHCLEGLSNTFAHIYLSPLHQTEEHAL